ncbi:MAG: histidine kinase [Flavobacteriales bacterium]|nr:histidine kinase [Flavobacteriales bacterium]
MKPKFFHLFILFVYWQNWYAQNVHFEHITLSSGLPSEQIYDIFKCSRGFIWLATNDGLIKFDGTNYHVIVNASELSSIGSNLKQDETGKIWLQNFDGYFLYVQNDSLKQYKTIKSGVFQPYVIEKDQLIYGSNNQLIIRNLRSDHQIKHPKTFDILFCHALGNYWVIGGNKIEIIYKKTLKPYRKFQFTEKFNSLATFSNGMNMVIVDKSKNDTPIILINSKGDLKKGKITLQSTIQNVYLLSNEIWFFTKNGIEVFNNNFQPLKHKNFLHGKNVASFTKDENNFLWVASPKNGIYWIKSMDAKETSLPNDDFSAITHNNQYIYTGSNQGNIYQHHLNLQTDLVESTEDNTQILFMNFNQFQNYHLFTGNGFYIKNLSNSSVIRNYSSVKDICFIQPNAIGVAATGFAGVFDINQSALINNWYDLAFLKNIRAKSVAYDAVNQKLYIATNNGLYAYQHQKLFQILKNKKSIFAKNIQFVNQQLIGINIQNRAFVISNKQYHTIHPIANFQKLKTSNDKIYLSTANAVYQLLNNRLIKVVEISKYEPLIDFEILNGKCYAITKNKLIKAALNQEFPNGEKPKVYINQIVVQDKLLKKFEDISLNYNEKDVTIYFDAVNFDYFNDYELQYTINDQIYPINKQQREIVLANLKPDLYQISIRFFDAKNNLFYPSNQIISFKINPPFWKRLYFILPMLLALSLIVILFYRKKLKSIQLKNQLMIDKLELENNLKESKLQLIKSQMNPHFFFNAINNIQSYIVSNETKEASNYLHKLSDLTRKILEFSEVESVRLEEELESLILYLELQKMRFKDLSYTIYLEPEINPKQIKIPTMLLQPYVENAILHGLSHSNQEKLLSIHLKIINQEVLEIEIADNGIGRIKSVEINNKSSTKKKSFATKANLERIMLLNKNKYWIDVSYHDLYDIHSEANGTIVLVKIKL